MTQDTTHPRAIRPVACELYFLPVRTRTPLSFGHQTVTHVTCARVRMTVEDRAGNQATGWGETPLNVQWAWLGGDFLHRLDIMRKLCLALTALWPRGNDFGHPMELGHAFLINQLSAIASRISNDIPHLAQLVCASAFDVACHDAFGQLHQVPIYQTYSREWFSQDLSVFFKDPRFSGKYPLDYLVAPQQGLLAWHMVGPVDAISRDDLKGNEVEDGYPHCLSDWIARDGLQAIKIKLNGQDHAWDIDRLLRIGKLALDTNVPFLSADFNCTATNVQYVTDVLDDLKDKDEEIYSRLLYIEQPFGYDLEKLDIDVRAIAERKPILLDESAHDWRMVKLGLSRGWTGVALKTCKTQTNAILSLCWAREHQMQIMVQDLTNPMLAIIPHAQLAANVGTIAGVEVNACQFYPDASSAEAEIHPELYRRVDGKIDLRTLVGAGFGYGEAIHARQLPTPAASG